MSTTPNQETLDNQARLMEKLTQVQCIDAPKALRCMSGQTRLYLKLVKDFTNESQQRCEELVQLYTDNNWEVLCRRVHTLKTFTAYIGAYNLSELSAQMEALLNKEQHPKSLLGSICSELEIVIQALTPIFSEPTDALSSTTNFSTHQLKQALTTIMPLLEQSDLQVEDFLPSLTQLCQGTEYAEQVAAITHYVDDIEFELAVEIGADILKKLA